MSATKTLWMVYACPSCGAYSCSPDEVPHATECPGGELRLSGSEHPRSDGYIPRSGDLS